MAFKITKWGPKKLQAIFQEVEDEINGITPLQGRGIIFEWRDDGVLIETQAAVAASQASDGATSSSSTGGGGSTVIATEFVNVGNSGIDTDEILYSHDIGAGRLVSDGDSIRALYGVRIISGATLNRDVILTFGSTGTIGDATIAQAQSLTINVEGNIKVEALIMRSGINTFRYVTSILIGDGDLTELVRIAAGGVFADGLVSSWDDNLILGLFGGTFGSGAAAGDVTARMALIEYVPA